MSMSLLYWILMLLWLVLGLWTNPPSATNWRPAAGNVLLFLLLLIVGWQVFGAPVK